MMKTFRYFIDEDAPVNNVGSGNIGGTDEPFKKKGSNSSPVITMTKVLKRKKVKESSIVEKSIKKKKYEHEDLTDTNKRFMKCRVFEVDSDVFDKCMSGKIKYDRYSNYVGKEEVGEEIRQYGRKYSKEGIILRNQKTKEMIYLRRPNTT